MADSIKPDTSPDSVNTPPGMSAEASRRAVEAATDHEPRAVKVDDLIIDESSGEILELPENAGDVVEFLTYREVELKRGEDAYKQARTLVKLALKRELEKLDLRSLQTQYGRPVIRSRVNRKGQMDRLQAVARDHELTREQMEFILWCASSLDAKRLESLDSVPREAIEALIEETTSEWLQVFPILKPPPVIERVK